jgi:isoleucyl-tRNA synthetase
MGTVKDIVTRFWVSNGYSVERRAGWDTHGLPGSRFPLRCVCHWLILFILQVEHEIDKKLGITSKEDVMKMGIAKYNEE